MADTLWDGYILHILTGFAIGGIFFMAYKERIMWPMEAVLFGLISVALLASLWELSGEFFFRKEFDTMDIFFSIAGSLVPAVGVLLFSAADSISGRLANLKKFLESDDLTRAQMLADCGSDTFGCAEKLGVTIQYVKSLKKKYVSSAGSVMDSKV